MKNSAHKFVFTIFIFLIYTTVYANMKTPQNTEEWLQLAQSDKVAFVQKFFNALQMDSMDLVEIFYHPKAKFADPIGHHQGVDDIKKYYAGIYEPVTAIRFDFTEATQSGEFLSQPWIMTFSSSKLKGGEPIVVHGISHFKFDPQTHQVIEHRDYFDVGEMVYEHIPLLGGILRWIKNKLKA